MKNKTTRLRTWLFSLPLLISTYSASPLLYKVIGILPATAQNQRRDTSTQFKTYKEPNTYSLVYPLDWFVTRVSRDLAYITNRKIPKTGGGVFPEYFIKTDIQIVSENFQTLLNQNISSSRESKDRLVKRKNIQVANKNGVRLWFTEGETEI